MKTSHAPLFLSVLALAACAGPAEESTPVYAGDSSIEEPMEEIIEEIEEVAVSEPEPVVLPVIRYYLIADA